MKKESWLLALALVFGLNLKAQQTKILPCHTDEHYFGNFVHKHPESLQNLEDFNNRLETFQKTNPQGKKGAVIKIPVVFHVIHQYGDENISKAQIEDQMRVLNEDFRRLNADAANTRPVFSAVAADAEIEFVLAKKDPQGNCTEGINRVFSPLTYDADDKVKKVIYWPSDKYLNVWVVRTVASSAGDGTTTLGYAQFPWDRASSPTTDGIVVRSDYVGTIGTAANSGNKGRVTTHEIGHWLGLFHTFQGACSNVSWGEKIADTPPVAAASFGCNLNANTCSNDNPDLPDQIENYMDYANGNCMNMFTLGQKNAMQMVLSNYRSVLISNANALATGISGSPSVCAPVADFSNKVYSVCQGTQVTFTDLSYNGVATSRTWVFEGGTPSTSSDVNPTITYNTPGIYRVTLMLSNGSGSNTFFRDSVVIARPDVGPNGSQFSEGMESTSFPPKDWFLENSVSSGFKRVTGISHSGTSSALLTITQNTVDESKYSLITPPIDLGIVNDPVVNFWTAYAQRGSSLERLRVYTSVDCGATWVQLYYRAGALLASAPSSTTSFVPTADQWKYHEVQLTNFKGRRNLLLKFEIQTNMGNNLYIDDINIGSLTGVPSYSSSAIGLKVYPNPAAKQVSLEFNLPKTEKASIWISDLSGKNIVGFPEAELPEGNQQFDLNINNLQQGMYLVNIQVGDSRIVEKLMVIH